MQKQTKITPFHGDAVMMTHRFSLGLAAFLLIAFAAMSPAYAQRGGRGGMGPGGMGPGKGGPHEMRMEMGQCMIDELGLSAEQVAQIKAIKERQRDADKDLIKEMQDLRKEMREARRSGDETKFEQLRTQMQAKAEQLRAARQAMHEAVMNVLTPEQRAKFDAAREKCAGEQGGKGKRGRHGRHDCDGNGPGGQQMQKGARQNPQLD